MGWAIAVAYLLVGEAVSRYYTQKIKIKYQLKLSRKEEDSLATNGFLLFFFWLPFLFLLAIIALFKKTKAIKTKAEIQKNPHAILKKFCQGPMSLCDSAKYECSKCQSINQINALDKIYGEKVNN